MIETVSPVSRAVGEVVISNGRVVGRVTACEPLPGGRFKLTARVDDADAVRRLTAGAVPRFSVANDLMPAAPNVDAAVPPRVVDFAAPRPPRRCPGCNGTGRVEFMIEDTGMMTHEAPCPSCDRRLGR